MKICECLRLKLHLAVSPSDPNRFAQLTGDVALEDLQGSSENQGMNGEICEICEIRYQMVPENVEKH